MPESVCLHIQDQESGPIRVVDIPWLKVRIGRAGYCEVRLAQTDLAEEACRLYRRGREWQLVPVASDNPIWLDGERVECARALPFDAPFVVGTDRLTLRKDRMADPDWGAFPTPVPAAVERTDLIGHASKIAGSRPVSIASPVAAEPIVQSTLERARRARAAGNPLDPGRDPGGGSSRSNGWEARWKAAGAELLARAGRSSGGEAQRPVYQPGFSPVPLKEPRAPQARAPVAPPLDPVMVTARAADHPAQSSRQAWLTHDHSSPEPSAASGANDDDQPVPAIDQTVAEPPQSPADHAVVTVVDLPGEPERPSIVPLDALDLLPETDERHEQDPAVGHAAGSAASPSSVEWPSAQEILAAHRAMPKPRPAVVPKPAGRLQASPTPARGPEQWNPPAWLAGPPAAALICTLGFFSMALSWRWADDSYSASIMTDRLMLAGQSAQRRPLPESIVPPRGSWAQSTAQHLAHWAVFLNHVGAQETRDASEIRGLLERALEAAPVNPTARLVLARLEPPAADRAVSVRVLGLSRDAVSLAYTASRLLAAGNRAAALRLFSQALAIAGSAEPRRASVPPFNRDTSVARFLLPGEEGVRDIARELVLSSDVKVEEWSATLPRDPTSRVAVARLLREKSRAEADTLLRAVIDEPAPGDRPEPRALAACAEALALESRWQQAADQYRRAIELADDDTTRRSWWFNLADVASRLEDQSQRDTALRAAIASGPSDDITRRAGEAQRATLAPPFGRSTGAKAN